MSYLQATWTSEYIYVWETYHSLSEASPLSNDSIPSDSLSGLLKILSDQDLINYSIAPLSLKIPGKFGTEEFAVPQAIRMEPQYFVDLVSSFGSEIEDEYQLDISIAFWIQAVKLLLDFLSRGLFFPTVKRRGATLESCWELAEQEDDSLDKISKLAKYMPGISISLPPSFISIGDPSSTALLSFIKISVNSSVRSFLNGVNFIEGIEKSSEGYQTHKGNAVLRRDSIILAWLVGLTSQNSTLELSALEQTLLEQKIKEWSSAISSHQSSNKEFLQLEVLPPDINDPGEALELPWIVKIRLVSPQSKYSHTDVSLPEEDSEMYDFILLKELGRVLPIVPFLSVALKDHFTLDVPVTPEQAHELLVKLQPTLKELGISVKAPSWWEESASQVGLVVKLKPKNEEEDEDPTIFSSSGLVDFSWKFTIGDLEFSLPEFEKLLDQGRSLIFVGDRWVSLNPSKIKKNLEQLKVNSPQKNFTLFDALRLGLGGISGMSDFDVVRIDSEGWIQKIIDFQVENQKETEIPETFKGELRPYQEIGLAWLSFLSKVGIGGCLADDMGLGKTIQVLALLAKEAEENKDKIQRNNLLIVPMSILGNWEAEARKFVPTLNVYIHHGSFREEGGAFQKAVETADLVITTYSIVHRDYKSFRKIPWYRVILDEAQNIKNTDTKQTKAVRSLVEELSKAESLSKYISGNDKIQADTPYLAKGPLRLALTGTPLENRLQELWSIIDFLNPGLLGSLDDFRKRYVNPIEKSKEMEAANQLSSLIKPFILRRTKVDPEIAAELPDKIEMESLVHLTPEQASLYSVTLEQMMPKVREAEGIHKKGLVLSVITKLKQICIHPCLALKDNSPLKGRSGKLQLLEELLETILSEGDRVLIFTQFAQWGQLLAPYLEKTYDTKVPFFHGGLNRTSRDKIIRDFQSESGSQILVLSLKAGGFGLNLTRANQVIHLDQWWNPAIQNQATDRAYRIGQKNTVQVRTLISKGTLEEKINLLHKEKMELAQTVVGTTRNVITELNPDALEELLQLQTNVLMSS